MATAIKLFHPQSGLTKTGYTGFSWTSFFFSGIPAIMRGDVGIGLGVLVGTIVMSAFSVGLLGIIVNLIWAFVYNKTYTTKLIEAGYQMVGPDRGSQRANEALGIQTKPPIQSQSSRSHDYDRRKWDALVQYDNDIRSIVEKLSPYGQKYVDQLASAYMALNDKSYLPQIIQSILETAKADGSRAV